MSRLRVNAIELKRVNVVQHTSVPEFRLLRMRAGDPKVKLSMRIRADALVAMRLRLFLCMFKLWGELWLRLLTDPNS